MAVTKVIRYTTKPECADENERLIRAVFAEGPAAADATIIGSYRLPGAAPES